jgi:hypothetical protein
MLHRNTLERLSLCLAAGLLAGTAALAQQKYHLNDVAAAGDLVAIEKSTDMTMNLKVTVDGQELPAFKMMNREREKYTTEILAADKNGKPTVIRRTYSVATGEETDAEGKQKAKVSSLQGKTVTIKVAAGKATVTATGGKLDPEDEKSLAEEFSGSGSPFLPNREVAPGEEWTIDPKQLPAGLVGAEKADMKGRFTDVVDRGGHPAARIHIDMDVLGKFGGSPLPLAIKGAGEALFALDFQRPLTANLDGPFTIKGEMVQDGKKLQFDGDGTLKTTQTFAWQKVAGKAVSVK